MIFLIALMFFSSLQVHGGEIVVKEIPGVGGYDEYDTDGNKLWVVLQGYTKSIIYTSSGGGFSQIATIDGRFSLRRKQIGGDGLVYSASFQPDSSGSFVFGATASQSSFFNGKFVGSIWNHEFQLSPNGVVVENCKSYTVDGKTGAPDIILGPYDGLYIGSMVVTTSGPPKNGPSTVYSRGTATNGICNLQTKFALPFPALQLHKLPNGNILFESLIKSDIRWSTTGVGVMSPTGTVTEWLVHTDSTLHPLFLQTVEGGNNTSLYYDAKNETALVAYMDKGGGHAFLYKNGKVSRVYDNEDGLSTTSITASALHGDWFFLETGKTNSALREKFVAKNTATGVKYTSQDVSFPAGAVTYGSGTITSQGTSFILGSKVFQVDMVGVTGFPKPTVTLTATPASIAPGQSSQLSWVTTGCDTSVQIDQGVGTNLKENGSVGVSPTETTNYTLYCSGLGGSAVKTTTLTVQVPPTISSVVSNASYQPGFAPGQHISVFGSGFGFGGDAGAQVAFQLGNTRVQLDGEKNLRLYYVNVGQINAALPQDQDLGVHTLTAIVNGVPSSQYQIEVIPQSLAAFTFNPDPVRPSIVAPIITTATYGLIGDTSLPFNYVQAKAGEIVIIWGTGGGRTNPVVGETIADLTQIRPLENMPVILINGQPAEVKFAGRAPGFASLDQVNVLLPSDLKVGKHDIKVNNFLYKEALWVK